MGFNEAAKRAMLETYEGGRAYKMSPAYELYLLAVTSMMSGDTFYEGQEDRLTRFRELVREVRLQPQGATFLAGLARYAREEMHLRTMPTILAAELLQMGAGVTGRTAAYHAWVRGDEHLEALAYVDAIGQKRSKALLKAIANRLCSMGEYQFVKYASGRKNYSQKDAICLSHPVPGSEAQSALFKFVVHGWESLNSDERVLLPEITLLKSGKAMTWEQHISKHGSSAKTWAEAIDKMGYMALLRNLRNFVEKAVPEDALRSAADIIANPVAVARSKQLPFRFLSAYKTLPANTPQFLMDAVSAAADAGAMNIQLAGDSLVLVDCSGSMEWAKVSDKSTVTYAAAARCLGAALVRVGHCDFWGFGDDPVRVKVPSGNPVMATLSTMENISDQTGHGTMIGRALNATLRPGLKRIIVITDMQSRDHATKDVLKYLKDNPETHLFIIDMAGYGKPSFDPKNRQTIMIGGFSDRVFDFIKAVEVADPIGRILNYGETEEG